MAFVSLEEVRKTICDILEPTTEYLPKTADNVPMIPHLLWVKDGVDPSVVDLFDSDGNYLSPNDYEAQTVMIING